MSTFGDKIISLSLIPGRPNDQAGILHLLSTGMLSGIEAKKEVFLIIPNESSGLELGWIQGKISATGSLRSRKSTISSMKTRRPMHESCLGGSKRLNNIITTRVWALPITSARLLDRFVQNVSQLGAFLVNGDTIIYITFPCD
jgi:hypothetical protein